MKLDDLAQKIESDLNITDEQLQQAYDKLEEANPSFNTALSVEEIKDLAEELAETPDFGRSKGSAEFILTRLHVLVNGLAPHGISETRAETMFNPSNNMKDFAESIGIDVDDQIYNAREELKTRPVAVKRQDALAIMSDYYTDNKSSLPNNIAQHREEIVDRIMTGMKPELAFDVEELQ